MTIYQAVKQQLETDRDIAFEGLANGTISKHAYICLIKDYRKIEYKFENMLTDEYIEAYIARAIEIAKGE